MNHKKYQTVFFDLDHTLWDFDANAAIALKAIYDDFQLENLGIEHFNLFSKRYEQHNELFWERFRNGHVDREALRWKRLWHTFLDYRVFDKALAKKASEEYLLLLPNQTHLVEYTIELLDYCQSKGYDMAIITNGFVDTQQMKVNNSGLGHYFKYIVTSEDVQRVKPHREIFDKALSLMNVDSSRAIMIGDSLEADVMGAAQLDIDQVYYNPHQSTHSFKPTFEIACLSELKNIL